MTPLEGLAWSGWREGATRNRPPRNVVHVGEVARLRAVSVHHHRPLLRHPLHEAEQAHVGPSRRPIDGEIPHHRHVNAVEMMVAVAQRLARFLRRGVGRQRVIRVGLLAVGNWIAAAIQARGRGQHQLGDPAVAAHLQQVQRAAGVGLEIDPGILQALADAGAGGQVQHSVEGAGLLPQSLQRLAVADIGLAEVETASRQCLRRGS